MSQTTTAPRGLDTMDADDLALLKDMQNDGPEPATEPVRDAPAVVDETSEIELPDEGETAVRGRQPRTATVPHAKFAAVLEERKVAKQTADEAKAAAAAAEQRAADAEKKAAEAEQKSQIEQARINERIAILSAAMQQPQPQAQPAPVPAPAVIAEDPLPDRNTDPIGYFEALRERDGKALAAQRAEMEDLRAVLKGFQEQQNVGREVAELRNWAVSQEHAFQRQEPTYNAAMDYLKANRDEELLELGITDPARRQAVINDDVTAIAQAARRDGVNFAERLYRQAVRRGYQKAQPVAPVAAPAPTAPAAAVIPPLDAELASVDRAARIEEGRANSTTIGSLGAAPARTMTVEQILNLPEERFAELAAQLRESGRLPELLGS